MGAMQVSGTVIKVTPMRTVLRDADGVVVSLPNKVSELWLGLVWFGLVWFGLVWFGLVWFGLVWFGLVWLVWFGWWLKAASPPTRPRSNSKPPLQPPTHPTCLPHPKSVSDMVIYNRSRMVGRLPAQLGSVLRQPLRMRLRLGGVQPVGSLGVLRDAAAARLSAGERAGLVEAGSAFIGLGRLTESGVELLLSVRGGWVCLVGGGRGRGLGVLLRAVGLRRRGRKL